MATKAFYHPPSVSSKAHQRIIREREAAANQHEPIASLAGCEVVPITKLEAEGIILRYEWLGTMGRSIATYGLAAADGHIMGAAVFGYPGSNESRDVCGVANREVAICLERGACAHYAPKNAASFLISGAVKLAAADYGWRIFYAYADPEAGEIGTVYQAVNWFYIGQGVGRTPGRLREDWQLPDGKIVSSRTLRHRKVTPTEAVELGWVKVYKHPKHKYVHFEGTRMERARLKAELRYPILPYPKRAQ